MLGLALFHQIVLKAAMAFDGDDRSDADFSRFEFFAFNTAVGVGVELQGISNSQPTE